MKRFLLVALLLTWGVVPAAQARQSRVPDWARRAVWYQIFPERFRNGDPRNDPRIEDQRGAWPHDLRPPWHVHPWTSDWYELQPYEKANGRSIWFNLQRRRYGGDLQGVLDKLDYLQRLGVTALYLNPIFVSPSAHKYDTVVYQHVDPNFGPDPAGDRRLMAREVPDRPSTWHWTAADRLALKLIRAVHRRGMHIIFDGVFNHMGMTNPFFTDVVKRQQKSRFRDWFVIKSWDDAAKGTKFTYGGWYNVKELPSLRQDENGAVRGPRQYIFNITRRWMAPNGRVADGIDGWRLDVAYFIKHPFWREWCGFVRAINPRAYTTAEIIDGIEQVKPYVRRDEFDAVMNYNFMFIASDFFFGGASTISPTVFDRRLHELRGAFRPEVAYGMQNLLDSHDTGRLASNIVNAALASPGDWKRYAELSKVEHSPHWDTRRPDAAERRVQKLAVVFQMTYVGAPMIYYGDEVGMWGANDPCDRKPMIWDDLHYADERLLPDQTPRPHADAVAVDRDMLAHYRRCIHIRNAHPALQVGDFRTLLTDDARGVYAFARTAGADQVVVVLHNGDGAVAVDVPLRAGRWRDALNGGRLTSTGHAKVHLDGRWGAVLVR